MHLGHPERREEDQALKMARRSDCEVVLTRYFSVPRARVFDALTNLEMLKRWFGPAGWSVVDPSLDLRVGGSCDLTMCAPDGKKLRMHAVYREIALPRRIVRTEFFEGWPPVESIVDLAERGCGTALTATIVYPSRETCEADIAGGLERDAIEAYDKLARCLAAH
jgi:uncharacterized protein YndB with AHSA1/START domain